MGWKEKNILFEIKAIPLWWQWDKKAKKKQREEEDGWEVNNGAAEGCRAPKSRALATHHLISASAVPSVLFKYNSWTAQKSKNLKA